MTAATLPRLRSFIVSLVLLGAIGTAQAEVSPFAGTWKVTLSNQKFDLSLWLLNIDREGKKVGIVSGLDVYARSKIVEVKSGEKTVEVRLTGEPNEYLLTMVAPSGKEKDQILGSMLTGTTIIPIWLQRTTLEELTQINAIREADGFTDLQEILKLTDFSERRKEMRAVISRHSGKPIHFLALQALLGDRIREKAEPAAFQELVTEYRKLAARHGELFQAGANLDLARNLVGHKASLAAAIDAARESMRLMKPTYPPALRLNAGLTLALGLHSASRTEEIAPLAVTLEKIAEELISKTKSKADKLATTQQLANLFLASPAKPVAAHGLFLAQLAVQLLDGETPLPQRASVHRLHIRALLAQGKTDEAKKSETHLARLEDELDQVYRKDLLPFKLEKVVRKKASGNIVLVEMFTTLSDRPAQAATAAFDAASATHAPSDVVFLQYHVIFPEPDVLVTPGGELRKAFYAADLEGIPAVFVNGKLTEPLGGARQRGEASYQLLKARIATAIAADSGARIKLEIHRKGELLTAKATVSGLKETGARIRLRLALVEERIRQEGPSGIRLHHQVLRSFLDGGAGLRLDSPDSTQSASIHLGQLRKVLGDYLDGLAAKVGVAVPNKPLALEKLRVIAFIQNEETKQVLAATQADVPTK